MNLLATRLPPTFWSIDRQHSTFLFFIFFSSLLQLFFFFIFFFFFYSFHLFCYRTHMVYFFFLFNLKKIFLFVFWMVAAFYSQIADSAKIHVSLFKHESITLNFDYLVPSLILVFVTNIVAIMYVNKRCKFIFSVTFF